MMEQAQEHMDSGHFAEAERIYRSILDHDPANTEAVFMLALARQAQGDLGESMTLMERAGELDPDNANVHFTLGTMQMAARAVDDARKSYLRALQADPFHIDSHNGLAFVELIAGNYSAAEIAANLALTEDARNVQALVYLGTAKLEQNDTTKAISYLQEALKEAPDHQSAKMQLGRAFLAAGNAAFAEQSFINVVEADPESGAAWELLASAQMQNKHFQEASESYRKALLLGRKSKTVLAGLAESEKALGNSAQADQLVKVLEDDSAGGVQPSGDAQLANALALARAGKEAEADEIIDAMLAQDEPPLAARIFRGFQLCRQESELGVSMLRKLESDEALTELDRFRINRMLAGTLENAGRFTEAAGYFGKLPGRPAQSMELAESGVRANRELLGSEAADITVSRDDSNDLPGDPVFIFTWPGSGWEWLAAGLGAHPGVMSVVDKPETQNGRRALISSPSGKVGLGGFTGDDASQAAQNYWANLESGRLIPANRLTLDAMWLSVDALPTLARIFPKARLLFVKREPKEMLLEWFRTGYSNLAGMAESYLDQLQALEQYRELLDIEVIDVDGGALVSDGVEGLIRLTSQLKLPWDDAMGTRLSEIGQSANPGRGSWSDYVDALAAPLEILDRQ